MPSEEELEEEEEEDVKVGADSAEEDGSWSHWLTSRPLMSISTLKKSRVLQ